MTFDNTWKYNHIHSRSAEQYLRQYDGRDGYCKRRVYLITSTFNKGAHFVLGTTQIVYVQDSNAILSAFLDEVSEGNSVEGSVTSAWLSVGNDVRQEDGSLGYYPITYTGDGMQYLVY